MTILDLAIIATFAALATVRFPGLRPLGVLLCLGVAVLPWTNQMPVPDRLAVYVPLDVLGGMVGVWSWARYRERLGAMFALASLLACMGHVAVAFDPWNWGTQWGYIAFLNTLFVLTCIVTGGTGFVRLHPHLFGSGRGHRTRSAAGHGG
jgi:hypothetical protein